MESDNTVTEQNQEKPKKVTIESLPEIENYSQLKCPISELSILERSLLFAELSNISYYSRVSAGHFAHQIGFPETRFYNHDGSQAYIFANEHDAVVACRGTEADQWNDIKADCDAVSAVAETVGHVHRGFKTEVDDLWPQLESALVNNEKTLWFTGHSLGGAMATICAGRCRLSHIPSTPAGLLTFGSPRVGDKRYVNFMELNHLRWVNNNDIVTRVPPVWFGFRHCGKEMYLNCHGKLRKLNSWQRSKDRIRGFWEGLKNFKIDHFSDHSINDYIHHIRTLLLEENINSTLLLKENVRIDRPHEEVAEPQLQKSAAKEIAKHSEVVSE